jgi:hypothetical protein
MPVEPITRAQVESAFDRLLALVAKNCDTATAWTVACVKADILDILTGDWHGDEPPPVNAAEWQVAL